MHARHEDRRRGSDRTRRAPLGRCPRGARLRRRLDVAARHVITGEGLVAALEGVDCTIETATEPSPEEDAAKEFFTTAARNLYDAGERAGVRRIVVVSIIGCGLHEEGVSALPLDRIPTSAGVD